MNKVVENLLAPYAAFFDRMSYKQQETIASAIVIAEAKHVAAIRHAAIEPLGGWKNKLPLEHSSPVGMFIKACRTGNRTRITELAKIHQDKEVRETFNTLCNAENVYANDCKNMTVDELIAYAATEIYYA